MCIICIFYVAAKCSAKLAPLSLIGKVSFMMVLLCAFLNFMRLILFITQYPDDQEDEVG